MLQALFAAVVLFSALALLVASHRVGHRLFVRISALVSVIAAVVLGTLLFQGLRPPKLADPASVSVTIEKAHPVEVGYRIEFVAANRGTEDTRQLVFDVHLAGCPQDQEDSCHSWGTARVDMPMRLAQGGQYPFARVLEFEPLPDDMSPEWQVDVTRVELYR